MIVVFTQLFGVSCLKSLSQLITEAGTQNAYLLETTTSYSRAKSAFLLCHPKIIVSPEIHCHSAFALNIFRLPVVSLDHNFPTTTQPSKFRTYEVQNTLHTLIPAIISSPSTISMPQRSRPAKVHHEVGRHFHVGNGIVG